MRFCATLNVPAFRFSSRLLPLRTHPDAGYDPADLPGGRQILEAFRDAGKLAEDLGVRTLLHPEQIAVLSARDPAVVANAVGELVHQNEMADWLNVDTLTIHGGGGYGDKPAALARLTETIRGLPDAVRRRLALGGVDTEVDGEGGEPDHPGEVRGFLLVPRRGPAELLDPPEEPLHHVPVPVPLLVVPRERHAGRVRLDARPRPAAFAAARFARLQ